MYVIEIRPEHREVVIGPREALAVSSLRAGGANWLADRPAAGEEIGVRIRHGAAIVPATVLEAGDDGFALDLALPQHAVTPGQSAVLYRDDLVVGGGVIHAAGPAARRAGPTWAGDDQWRSPSASASFSSASRPSSESASGTRITTRTS